MLSGGFWLFLVFVFMFISLLLVVTLNLIVMFDLHLSVCEACMLPL